MNILFDLFLTFAKIGLFTFGGGYAMISLIENSCVEKKGWITHDEMMNVTVIAESTPGPIAINCATFVGYRQKGLIGAAVATVGMVFPSFCIIFLISLLLDNFLEIAWIANAFKGIKIAVGILILDAAIKMIKKMQKKPIPLTIMTCAFLAMLVIDIFALHVSSITLMLIAAVISLTLFLIAPIPGGTLTHAEASYNSTYGKVTSAWQIENGRMLFTFEVPANCTAEMILPNGKIESLNAGRYTYEQSV